MRIGQLAERVGVTPHVLRAWEKRYGLLRPVRSASGYRLYGMADERRVRAVLALRDRGVPASDAVARVLNAERAGESESAAITSPAALISRLLVATASFDEPDAQTALDEAFALPLDVTVGDVLMPFLNAVGQRWAVGELDVAQEHFASNLVRRRLASRTGTWGHGTGPRVLLSCVPGETHDLALMAFGLLLDRRGWRVSYLGQDTPAVDIIRTADVIRPDLVVLAVARIQTLAAVGAELDELASRHRVAYGGAGAVAVRKARGVYALPPDVVAAADAAGAMIKQPWRRHLTLPGKLRNRGKDAPPDA